MNTTTHDLPHKHWHKTYIPNPPEPCYGCGLKTPHRLQTKAEGLVPCCSKEACMAAVLYPRNRWVS